MLYLQVRASDPVPHPGPPLARLWGSEEVHINPLPVLPPGLLPLLHSPRLPWARKLRKGSLAHSRGRGCCLRSRRYCDQLFREQNPTFNSQETRCIDTYQNILLEWAAKKWRIQGLLLQTLIYWRKKLSCSSHLLTRAPGSCKNKCYTIVSYQAPRHNLCWSFCCLRLAWLRNTSLLFTQS